ncbi:hypothetical protein NQ176_g7456 [Zarea fungicola]|uniref:Uncharacterized protein n=1 Tax=Zarea fungicola TaxID=93591 RepID=A0ACC1MY32_9HYPO|nr:hypothetical protein NQ176_g7456 [Lecanicillium fungicola]
MVPTEKSTKMTLQGPDEWESWNEKLKARAISENIWKFVNPDTDDELDQEPPMPDVGRYPRREVIDPSDQESQSHSAGRSRRTVDRDRSPTLDSSFQHQHSSQMLERAHPTLKARGVYELLPADRSAYDLEVRIRTQEHRDFKEKQASISKLRAWIEESINGHLWTTCCNAKDTIRDWYINLNTSVCTDTVHLRSKARDRYQLSIQPLRKIPPDFEAWIKQWREAFANAELRDVADVVHSADWFKDVSKAVKDVLPAWGSSFRNGHRDAIRSDTLDYKEVAASLFEEADVQGLLKKQAARFQKGAFGPTAGPEGDQSTHMDESEENPMSQRKGRKRKASNEQGKDSVANKRKREDSDNQSHDNNSDQRSRMNLGSMLP